MESKKPDKEKDDKSQKNEKSDLKESNDDFSKEKMEEENIFFEFLKNSLLNEEQNKEKNKNPLKTLKLNNAESSFISESLTKLQNGDDMDIMSELISLCEKISLASDQIGDNPSMPKLLEEICKNLEKLYLPEIIIYSLQCINYIIDINPGLTSVLKRVGAVPKIIGLVSAMEDLSCVELIVSLFEKISFENSFLLFESNIFLSLLNIIDFLGPGQRKSVMKICQNISVNAITYNQFNQYIKPALEQLCYLTKFNEENSYVNEKAIYIYYNIIILLNQGFYFYDNPELENELNKYSFMENFCEILKKYFFEYNKKITEDIIKKILKIINIKFKVSKKETEKLFSLGFLNIIKEIIHHEFNDYIVNENNKISISKTISVNNSHDTQINPAKNSASFLNELFLLLTSLFPENDKKEEKILSKENENYYEYLCKNIIKPLIDNIMTKSACSTLNNLIKFILVFSKYATKEKIQNCINSKQMAQIISKLLDTKYEPYVSDLISLIEIFMSKTPEHFVKNFIREGIVENFRNYDFKPKKSSNDSANNKKKKKKEKTDKNKENKEKDKESDSFSDILDNENNEKDNFSDGYVDMDIDNNENNNEEQIDSGNDDDSIPMDIENNDKKEDEKIKNKDKDELKEKDKKDNNKSDNSLKKIEVKVDDAYKNFLEKEKLIKQLFEKKKKKKKLERKKNDLNNKILLEAKMKDFINKYFSEEKIKFYLNNIKSTELINLKDTLTSLEKDLKNACETKNGIQIKNSLQKIIQILSDPKNEITLFELEYSKILLGLCNFFEPIFQSQYDKLNIENDNEIQKNINLDELLPSPLIMNREIFEKTKLFLEILENKNNLFNYIKLLEYSITSMNCFTMIINETQSNYNLNVYYNQSLKNVKKYDLRIIYSDESYIEKIENNKNIDDIVFMEKLIEYNEALKSMKEVKFLLSEGSIVDDMTSVLLSHSNVTLVANEKYDVTLVYYLNLKYKNNVEKFEIDENWTIRDLKKAILKKYGPEQGQLYFGSPIYIGLNFKKKEKKDTIEEIKDDKKEIKGFIDYLVPFDKEIRSSEEILDFDKISFIKEYHTNIIYSKSLYEIKRLMPSLFLLSIINLSIKKYPILFGLNEDWLKNKKEIEDLFINSKVNLLIFKASSDGSNVAKNNLPSWCKNLSLDCGFLSKYESRSLLFKVCFDYRRSLINLQNYFKSIDPNYPTEYNITLEKSMRLKIIVDRNKILEHGFTLLDDAVSSKFFGFLEFEYVGEIGNGLGPTLEFYYLVFEKLKEDKRLWYKTTDGYLYPNLGLNDNKECIKLFKLLGYIIGRAIYDDRLMDIPLSRVFWDLALERPVLFKDMETIDKNLYKAINDLKQIKKKKKELIKNNPNISEEEIENKVLYNNKKLNELDIYFIFPGNNDIELKQGGSDILLTMRNVEEYVNLIYDFIFYRGIYHAVDAFKEGFNLIYNIFNLKCFSSSEIEEYVCGSLEIKWDEKMLYENLKPDRGYTKNSRIFNDLVKFMCKLDKEGQRQFLIFTTGTSRLPVGGFKALSPKLTIVKSTLEQNAFPDDYLPTVMTCQNYLKLPDYSSYQVLEKKLLLSMKEGSKEFSLS